MSFIFILNSFFDEKREKWIAEIAMVEGHRAVFDGAGEAVADDEVGAAF